MGGVHGGGMCGRVSVWQGMCMVGGACMAGGMRGRGHAWQDGMGTCVAGETATAAGGTHPTGIHSC